MESQVSKSTIESDKTNSVSIILTACVISFYMTFLVISENFVFGSIRGRWTYGYFETVQTIPSWIPVLVGISLSLSVFLGSKFIHSHEKFTLFVAYFNILFVQILIRKVYPFSLEEIVLDDRVNSFFTPAIKYSAFDIISKFSELAPTFPKHARTNMPGKILLFEVFTAFTNSPEIMGLLVIALSSVGALLLYGICKQLFHDKKAAFYALILYGLIPSKLFFFPILNTVTPVFILFSFYLFIVYIEKKSLSLSWFLGISLYILILFEPSPLATGMIFIAILIHAIYKKSFSLKDFWTLGTNLILAFLCTHIFFNVILSFNIFQTFEYILNDAVKFNQTRHRGYWRWVGENAKEFFFSVGVPIAVIFIYMTAHTLSRLKKILIEKKWSLDDVYLISVIITYIAITFIGVNRGEITRLWIYLSVFFQIPISRFIAKIPKGEILFFLVLIALTIQTILTLQRVEFIGI